MRRIFYLICMVLSGLFVLCSGNASANDDILLSTIPSIAGNALRLNGVRVSVSPFGPGSVYSDRGGISYNYSTASGTTSAYFKLDYNGTVGFFATPEPNASIADWIGCDVVSTDKTECMVYTDGDKSIEVVFHQNEITTNGTIVDVTSSSIDVTGNSYYILVDPDDSELISKLANIHVDDILVATGDTIFLRKITGFERINDTNYIFQTISASLEDVFQEGTIHIRKQFTHADLAGDEAASYVLSNGRVRGRVKPSDNPADTVFTIQFGEMPRSGTGVRSLFEPVTLYDDGNNKVVLSGDADIQFTVDQFFDFGWFGLQEARIVPKIIADQSLAIECSGEISKSFEKKVGTLQFGKLLFSVFGIPVVVVNSMDIKVGATVSYDQNFASNVSLNETLFAGFSYLRKRNPTIKWTSGASATYAYSPPELTAELATQAYLKFVPQFKFYNITGPAFDVQPYLALDGDADLAACSAITFIASAGVNSNFHWDFPSDTAFGDILGLDELEKNTTIELLKQKWKLREWHYESNCAEPGKLQVEGNSIDATHRYGASGSYAQEYTLKNVGEGDLRWSLDIPSDTHLAASKTSGSLSGGASDTVTVAVGNTSTLPLGLYRRIFRFKQEGSREAIERRAEITVVDASLSSPTLFTPVMAGETSAKLSWTYPGSSEDDVRGYYVGQSTDGTHYTIVATLASPTTTQATITGLAPGTTYFFHVIAYDRIGTQSDPSTAQQLDVPDIVNSKPVNNITGLDSPHHIGVNFSATIASADSDGVTAMRFAIRNALGAVVYQKQYSYSGASTSVSEALSISTSAWSAGSYSYVLYAQDGTGLGGAISGNLVLVASGGPLITLTAPTTGGSYPLNGQATIQWSTQHFETNNTVELWIKRDSAVTLDAPDNINWHSFTDFGADGANDGVETVTIPGTLKTGSSDWRFYVVKHDQPEVYDFSDSVYAIHAASSYYSSILPDTGITQCYDDDSVIPCPAPGEDFYGQDANYNPAATQHSYTDNSDGTVTDNVTGLMWMQDDNDSIYTWQNAINYCSNLTHAGYSDWRLPDYYELSFLTDRSRYGLTIDSIFDGHAAYYWTSSPYAVGSGHAWFVDFYDGSASFFPKYLTYYVRCVRSGP